VKGLGSALESLYASTDWEARRALDPVSFAHRYSGPRDQEIAGLLAALFAYGRVTLFRPVLDEVLGLMGASPRGFVEGWDRARDAGRFEHLVYRWNRGIDLVHLFDALQEVLEEQGSLGALSRPSARSSIETLVDALSNAAARREGCDFADLPRGFRSWMTRPSKGSACKRWAMYLRWMVRPSREGVDLGLWDQPASGLIVPMDVHVLRISRFIGLTDRRDASWRTAREVTAGLARYDATDPVRYDFAIAHLGISGLCVGHRRSECGRCPLDSHCSAGSQSE